MSLGFEALVRLALAQAPGSAVTALTAANGRYSLTGEAATFQSTFVVGFGSFALTGETQTLSQRVAGSAGGFTLTGGPASFEIVFAEAQGFASIAQSLGGSALGALALGQGKGAFGAVGTLSLSYALAGEAVNSADFEIARGGNFALTGAGAYLSYDLLGGGGTIVAGTFSRDRWRALQEELAAEREEARRRHEEERRRRREARAAAAAAERELREAALARIDAANASAAAERVLADALAAAARGEHTREVMQHAAVLHALALAAQERARAQDEDEALALLLAA